MGQQSGPSLVPELLPTEVTMTTKQQADVPLRYTARGPVSRAEQAYALRKIENVLRHSPEPVLRGHVVITVATNPAQDTPARIEVGTVVGGQPIRAQVAAEDVCVAADLVVDRLQRRLDDRRERRQSRSRRSAAQLHWRHAGLPSRRSAPPRSGESSPLVVKRKTFVLSASTPAEAADQMDLLDHDFYLFADRETGAHAVVYRRYNGDYGVLGPIGGAGPDGTGARPPRLTAAQARDRLARTTDRFLFYRSSADDSSRILYRRFDGYYGLLVAGEADLIRADRPRS